MYFAINKNGYSGYGSTLQKAIEDLEEQDSSENLLPSLKFYKAEEIKVELRQVEMPVEIKKITPTKKAKA
jgi:hypothetical protein